MELKKLLKESHSIAKNKGFWDKNRNDSELLMLCVSELGETCEALRHGNPPSEHIPNFSSVEEELADCIIRIADMAEARGYRLEEALEAKLKFNKTRPQLQMKKILMTVLSYKTLVHFLNKYQNELKEPIADYGGNENIGEDFVKKVLNSGGLTDLHTLDYSSGVDLMKPIKGKKYGLGICMDTLEHVKNPFTVGNNISNSLKKGALLYVTVPFVWTVHGYDVKNTPTDYFRFTEEGIKLIFPKLTCLEVFMLREPLKIKGLPQAFVRVIGVFRKDR